MIGPVRRVVTGEDAAGRSHVVSDDQVEPTTATMLPGAAFHKVWGTDVPVALPADGQQPAYTQWFPAPGGVRFAFCTLPPAVAVAVADGDIDRSVADGDIDRSAAVAEMRQNLPGLLETFQPNTFRGAHRSDTVDYIVVLSGTVTLLLDDDETVDVGPGDVVIQNGTRHAWRNSGAEPCVLAVALIGADRPQR